ncbi:substrate-binding domain-containing protein [Halolactibacillus sp. JCM 19043]|uniref:substrate-binding domain-containing protein n=1 Tax=Halolactibacillus sp. JCM 19043 TaxID=1460638 RepID=UPI0007852CB6|nr:substrate-binding domain-containing protein [Halolactibacillus sp. JCM 19043]
MSVDEMADPPLTTIRQPVYDVGRLLAKKLIRRIDNINATVVNELIEPDLIIRKSIKNNK